MNSFDSVNQITNAVTRSPYMAGSNNVLSGALNSARNVFFTPSNGDRLTAQNFIVVIANSVADVASAVTEVSQAALLSQPRLL